MIKITTILEVVIYVLIGAIGGRAFVHKDWVTLVSTIVLWLAYVTLDYLRKK